MHDLAEKEITCIYVCMLVFIWPVLIHASCFFKLTLNVFIDLCFILFFLQTFENGGNNHLFLDLTQQSHIHTQPLLCLMCTMYINRNRTPSKIHKIISLEFTFPSLDFYSRILCPFLLSRLRSSQFSALINFNLQLFMCSLTLCQRACVPTPTCETTTQNYHNENLKKNIIYSIVCSKNVFLTLHFISEPISLYLGLCFVIEFMRIKYQSTKKWMCGVRLKRSAIIISFFIWKSTM